MLEIILLIAVCLTNLALGVFVLLNNTKATLNRVFAGFAASLAVWSGVSFFEDAPISHGVIELLVRIDFISGSLIIGFFFWFCYTLVRSKAKPLKTIILLLTLASATLGLAGQMVSLDFQPNRVKFVDEAGYPVFIVLTIAGLLSGLGLLAWGYRRVHGRERSQLRFIYFGIFLMFFVLITTNVILPNLMVVTPVITRLGIYGILFFTSFSAYAIVRHRLFDIRLVAARSVAYLLLITTLSALYGLGLFTVGALFFPQSGLNNSEIGVFIALAIIMAFTLQPLLRFFEKITDKVFFRDRYDSQVVLGALGSILSSELILDTILDKSLKEICRNLHIATARFVIYEKARVYKRAFYGMTPSQLIDTGKIHRLRPGTLVADEMSSGQRKDILVKHGIRVSLELWANDEVVGHLLLGDKLSGEIYSTQDITLLEILRKELAVAIANARAYEEIALFNATLQDRVTKATAHLRAANVKLEVLDKAKDDFISMASHQLGTPLTAITGYLSMALNEDRKNMTESQRDSVSVALESAERLVNMASDLLNVSRLNAGRFSIVRQPVDLSRMIQQEVLQLEPSAGRKGLKLSFTPPATALPQIPIDESKTRQVIMNFIDNAIYYTPTGSVKVSLAQDDGQVILKVTDTGMGVAPDEVPKLFAKFYRAQNAKEARPDGTGLGLYLAKKVIEDQGGELIFESKLGQGSTFGFKLPLKPKPIKPTGK